MKKIKTHKFNRYIRISDNNKICESNNKMVDKSRYEKILYQNNDNKFSIPEIFNETNTNLTECEIRENTFFYYRISDFQPKISSFL